MFDSGIAGSFQAPVILLRDVASEVGLSPDDRRIEKFSRNQERRDILSSGLLKTEEAIPLIALFQEHYGRWVSFDTATRPEMLLHQLRSSPLLLAACCLIAIRHTNMELAGRLADPLFQEVKSLLTGTILSVPQSVEFFQASVVLSFWSTTIGQSPLSLDSWLLSGFALQHGFASAVFSLSAEGTIGGRPKSKGELDRLCIWNHLCLSHLHYCVGTRRTAVLQRSHVDRCRWILDSDHATNFECRIIAEIYLYWTIYEHCYSYPVDLPKIQAALRAWKLDWEYLFEQPRTQFLQMGLHFAHLVAYDHSLKSRSAAVRESLLSEMVRLSVHIISMAMETADDRTRHLSDHIYHMITFAAVTICRLLHMYESQLTASNDLAELDKTVLTLATWLHSIGPPCHVAHTFGDVVAAFHKKLRPSAQPTSPTLSYQEADPVIDVDFASLFPDLFGTNLLGGTTPELLPDWDPNFG
ncbi:hypothetical protein NA57DRAFT_75668 [Rhizodiscina lignyota]|uniref:Transcription factor domain-containing protein n=1 Tax=Rhizodiscina lignyota TaxID=1504668 RepID=A0A9P4IAR9_9PEZI|nr:hypothetical protein NA57DRAFT_75668 [Rhizodiscina lignyota]